MDPKRNFTEEDMSRVVKFLNLVAKHARFDVDTAEMIEYFQHLQFMQKGLLPKIEGHILEVKRVIQSQEAEAEAGAEESSGDSE